MEPDKGNTLDQAMTQEEVNVIKAKMSPKEIREFDAKHLCIREKINHPNISGPFDTGWGYTEFDGDGLPFRIGLPDLPGQMTALNR